MNIMSKLDAEYKKQIENVKIYSAKELKNLINEYYKTKDIKTLDKILLSLQCLIIKTADKVFEREHIYPEFNAHIDAMDLIQEANYKIIDALQRELYKPSKAAPSTYFTTAVKNCVGNYICKNKGYFKYSLTASRKTDAMKKYRKAIEEGMEEKKALRKFKLNKKDFIKYPERSMNSLYDLVYQDDNETELVNVIEDKNSVSPEAEVIKSQLYSIIKSNTNPTEYALLLDKADQYTVKEMAVKHNLTEKEVSFMIDEAEKRLRNCPELQGFQLN